MFKQLLRKHSANRDHIHRHRWARFFGSALHNPNLWHVNRRSVARAFAVGLFWCIIPIPLQMLPSAAFAIWLRGNVALAVALAWITNPITIPPAYYGTYRLGKWILGTQLAAPPDVQWSRVWDWSMWRELGAWTATNTALIWKPLYLGSTIAGIVMAVSGYVLVGELWKLQIRRRWVRSRRVASARA